MYLRGLDTTAFQLGTHVRLFKLPINLRDRACHNFLVLSTTRLRRDQVDSFLNVSLVLAWQNLFTLLRGMVSHVGRGCFLSKSGLRLSLILTQR